MPAHAARGFLLKPESYFRIELPRYFDFGSVLHAVEKALRNTTNLFDGQHKPERHEGVNYTIYSNKDGKFAWRPLQLVHPVLYVELVNLLTRQEAWKQLQSRFEEFAADTRITCLSLPQESLTARRDQAAQIAQWWEGIEQKSLEYSLDFSHAFHADIAECYSSIYTHSIPWALHEKEHAKANKGDSALLGNAIDRRIRAMQHGQTNGIPQGSVLLDLIAELVLGYADLELSRRLSTDTGATEFRILRYRDDYRIFSKTSDVGEAILKVLTEVLMGLGLKLNTSKTAAADPVAGALKPDKLAWLRTRQRDSNLQKHLLLIHCHAKEHPNAGSVAVALDEVYGSLGARTRIQNPIALIGIVVDIGYHNPRSFPVCAAIVSKIVNRLPRHEQVGVAERIRQRLKQFPNSGHLEVWLQRMTYKVHPSLKYEEPLCCVAQGEAVTLWNSDWLTNKGLKATLDVTGIVNRQKRDAMRAVVPRAEFGILAEY